MTHIEVTIEGVSPLLMGAFPEVAQAAIEAGRSSALKSSAEKGTPRDRAELRAYRMPTGNLCIPADHMRAALVESGKHIKVGRSKITTSTGSLVPAGVFVEPEQIDLGVTDYELDVRRGVNPATKGACIIHRPRLDEWRASFAIEVDPEMFTAGIVRELLDIAGKRIGIMEFRPSKKGPYGRFVVTAWKVENGK